ncbi:hypothetical protein [Paenibacillus caui]|uniref:hypothetical protein n=1 Tax=Paenibacillus caui TaxID=2873927 RepID=UPI001CA9CC28|nr:hypothetical protein [Paenibacillus caui]
MDHKNEELHQEPGFDSLPDPDPERPAPTDYIEEAVGDMMNEIQEDLTDKPEDPDTANKSNS